MNYLGATIIAGIVFFVLNLLSTFLLQSEVTTFAAFLEAIVKTAIFGLLSHYLHNFVAGKFGWYDPSEGEK